MQDVFKLLHRYDCQNHPSFSRCLEMFAKMVPRQDEIPKLLEFADVYDLKIVWERCAESMKPWPLRKRRRFYCWELGVYTDVAEIVGASAICHQCDTYHGVELIPNALPRDRRCQIDGPEWDSLAKKRPDIILKVLKMVTKGPERHAPFAWP